MRSSPKLRLGSIALDFPDFVENSRADSTDSLKASLIVLMDRTMNWVVTTRLKVCQRIRRPLVFELAFGIVAFAVLPKVCQGRSRRLIAAVREAKEVAVWPAPPHRPAPAPTVGAATAGVPSLEKAVYAALACSAICLRADTI